MRWYLTLSENENERQKKPKQVQIPFPRVANTLLDAKKIIKKKSAHFDFGENVIYPISYPDGQTFWN